MNRKLLKKAITELQIENDPKSAILDIFLTSEHLQEQIVDIQALVNRLFTEKPTEVAGLPGRDGRDGRDGADGKDGLSIYPEQVIDELRKLKGKHRLTIANIDGLEEAIWEVKLMTGKGNSGGGGGVPSDSVVALDGTANAGTATQYSRGDHKHADVYRHTHANFSALNALSGTNTGDQDLSGLVPKTTQVNGKPLSSNITLTFADVGAEPSNTNIQTHIAIVNGNPHGTTADMVLPNQTGQAGKYLKTNGTTASWQTVPAGSGGYSVTTVTIASVSPADTSGEVIILCNYSAGGVLVNLPTAVGNTAKFTIKKIDSSANQVTVDGNGSETIDGDLTQIIQYQWTSIVIVSDGANWFII